MGDRQINNPNGAFGYTDADQKFPHTVDPYIASGAITAKLVVQENSDGTVSVAPTNGTASKCIGVAQEAAEDDRAVRVVTEGHVSNVPADGAIADGALLKRSTNTAGYVAATATPGVGEVIGVAVGASASNVVTVNVLKGA